MRESQRIVLIIIYLAQTITGGLFVLSDPVFVILTVAVLST
jgi:hypothetical protein